MHVEREKECDVCFGNNPAAVALRKKQMSLMNSKAGVLSSRCTECALAAHSATSLNVTRYSA